MNAVKLCAATVLVRVRVETMNVDSRIGLWMLNLSARPDHRKEEGADTQGLMAAGGEDSMQDKLRLSGGGTCN